MKRGRIKSHVHGNTRGGVRGGNREQRGPDDRFDASSGAGREGGHASGDQLTVPLDAVMTPWAGQGGVIQRRPSGPHGEEPGATPYQSDLPVSLREGLEELSGEDLADVRVHHNADEPAQVGASAFARGSQIYLAPGEESHLQHEGWHVVQQRQGRVAPTTSIQGVPVNDSPELEREADAMGERAARRQGGANDALPRESGRSGAQAAGGSSPVVQRDAVAAAGLAFTITNSLLSSAGGGSDLTIRADEMTGMFFSRSARSLGQAQTSATERKAHRFEYLLESVLFREDLIRVAVVMDYERGTFGVGNISFSLVEAHDSGAGWGGRFEFNLTPRDSGAFGAVTLTVNFDVSGWIGSVSGSFSYEIHPYGGVRLTRSRGDVGGWSGMNQQDSPDTPS